MSDPDHDVPGDRGRPGFAEDGVFSAMQEYVRSLQDDICATLESIDGDAAFTETNWQRPAGGGGRTRILQGGAVFEKAGVNTSTVHGDVPAALEDQMPGTGDRFRATGISLVLHPASPMVPTVHANYRRIERGDRGWFGGGADLTPYLLFDEDAEHFHGVHKAVCDRHAVADYRAWKQWCDEYFFLPHRGEHRGVGGIFFDHLDTDPHDTFSFVRDAGEAFCEAYVPIVQRRLEESWDDADRMHQLVRRGRYVEFNLVYDRGTVFGLRTQGNIESILMSLPDPVRWVYGYEPPAGSRAARTVEVLREPRDWA